MSEDPQLLFQSADVLVRLMTMAPHEIGPSHHHSHLFETVICVEGEIALCVAGNDSPGALSPGQQASVAAPQVHWLENRGAGRARYVLAQSGGAYDFIPAA